MQSVEASPDLWEWESEWQRKGATLSDKTAREEYGLTQDDIIRAIWAGTLHYREGSMYGSPSDFRRREVRASALISTISQDVADRP